MGITIIKVISECGITLKNELLKFMLDAYNYKDREGQAIPILLLL